MTYRELALQIDRLPEEQKDKDVTRRSTDGEYFRLDDLLCSGVDNDPDEHDILDAGHPYLEG